MNYKYIFLLGAALTGAVVSAASVAVSNVALSQDLATREIKVDYTLAAEAVVRCDIKVNGVSIGRENFRSFSGDYSKTSATKFAAGSHSFIWDALADWPDQLGENLTVEVLAFTADEDWRTHVAEAVAFEYIDIDISGGSASTSYPVVWRDSVTLDANDSGAALTTHLVLRRIPAGSVRNESGNYTIEWTKPFYMAVYETTNKQWERVMGSATGSTLLTGDRQPATNISYEQLHEPTAVYPSYVWDNDNTRFLGKLNRRTGFNTNKGTPGIRLPSELQWEYAARAGVTGDYAFGASSYDEAVSAGMDISCSSAHAGEPNAFGLYCMPGGVAEICGEPLHGSATQTPSDDHGGNTRTDYYGWASGEKVSSLIMVRDYQAWLDNPSSHFKLGERVGMGWIRSTKKPGNLGFRVVWNP